MRNSMNVLVPVIALCLPCAFAGAEDATVYLVHGVPGEDVGLDPDFAVDVQVDGDCEVDGLVYGEIIGPVAYEPGLYDFAISPDDPEFPCGNAPILERQIEILSGETVTVIVHLNLFGEVTVSRFAMDVSPTNPGRARVTITHVADADPAYIKLKRGNGHGNVPKWIIDELEHGEQASNQLRPGNWRVDPRPGDEQLPKSERPKVRLKPKNGYWAYIVGSMEHDTLDLIVIKIKKLKR